MFIPARLLRWQNEVHLFATYYKLDPLLLFAIMDRESLGGDALSPPGPGGTGDKGHGRGLMQIDDRAHKGFADARDDKDRALWSDPSFNIHYGARHLREAFTALGGDVAAAVAAYNAGVGKVKAQLRQLPASAPLEARVKVLNLITHGGDYVSDVLRRRDRFIDGGKS